MPELRYVDGALTDGSGQRWRRVRDWVEPDEAAELVRSGTAFAVQGCRSAPVRGEPARFRRDVLRRMLTRNQAGSHAHRSTVPTIMVGELWRSDTAGDLLLCVEQGPRPRSPDELVDED